MQNTIMLSIFLGSMNFSILTTKIKMFCDYNEAQRSVNRKIEQKSKWLFM